MKMNVIAKRQRIVLEKVFGIKLQEHDMCSLRSKETRRRVTDSFIDKEISMEKQMNDRLDYPDFGTWFATQKEIRKAVFKTVLGVDKKHLALYVITGIISILMVLPYGCDDRNSVYTIFMSIGASGVGAALIGYFNELVHNRVEQNKSVAEYNDYIVKIYFHAFKIFACNSFLYLKSISANNGKEVAAKQSADKILFQFQIITPTVEEFILRYCHLFDGETMKFYQELNDQIMHFEGSLQSPVDVDNLIDVMEGIRLWLRGFFTKDRMKKQFLQ